MLGNYGNPKNNTTTYRLFSCFIYLALKRPVSMLGNYGNPTYMCTHC